MLKTQFIAMLSASLLLSCNGPGIPGIKTYSIGVRNQHLSAEIISTSLQTHVGVTVPVPELPGATFGITPYLPTDGSADTGVDIRFDVDLTLLHAKNYQYAGLPDGRPLPDVSGGMLPRWTFPIQNIPVSLYLAEGAFAMFIPMTLEARGSALTSMISEEFDDEHGNLVGKIYAIPSQGTQTESGLLILALVPGQDSMLSGKPLQKIQKFDR